MRAFLEGAVVVLVIIGVIAAIIGLFWGLAIYSCNRLGENTGLNTEYHLFGGNCLVEINDKLIPEYNWIENSGN